MLQFTVFLSLVASSALANPPPEYVRAIRSMDTSVISTFLMENIHTETGDGFVADLQMSERALIEWRVDLDEPTSYGTWRPTVGFTALGAAVLMKDLPLVKVIVSFSPSLSYLNIPYRTPEDLTKRSTLEHAHFLLAQCTDSEDCELCSNMVLAINDGIRKQFMYPQRVNRPIQGQKYWHTKLGMIGPTQVEILKEKRSCSAESPYHYPLNTPSNEAWSRVGSKQVSTSSSFVDLCSSTASSVTRRPLRRAVSVASSVFSSYEDLGDPSRETRAFIEVGGD